MCTAHYWTDMVLLCTCSNQILHPEVPHSLRLQGILIGGVVVVFNRQASYLLEDVHEMMVGNPAVSMYCPLHLPLLPSMKS